ncbi:MAG: hypothetical protein NZ742_05070 [Acidobacteria bacterium]|nr:hypothetical protein [Acidobacteriota bacterium]MDW7983514.1 hypothetical protein [Acidobacteriota bacterium]
METGTPLPVGEGQGEGAYHLQSKYDRRKVRLDHALWGSVGFVLLILGIGMGDWGGRTFPLKACFQGPLGELRGLPLVWRGTSVGTVARVIPPQGGDRCTWVVLRVYSMYRNRIPVDSVVYVHPGQVLELVVLDPGSPALRTPAVLPARPAAVGPVERAWIDQLQHYTDLCSTWIRGFRRWVRSEQATADLLGARQDLWHGLEQRSVLGPCLSWSERRLLYTLLRQWMDLRDRLQTYGYPPSELDPLIHRLHALWADRVCDPTVYKNGTDP